MTRQLIGLTGKKGSGKNTVASFIQEWATDHGYEAEQRGFADALKLSFARIFVPDATLDESLGFVESFKHYGKLEAFTVMSDGNLFHKFGKLSITGREAIQNYGTEAHREVFGTDFWVDHLLGDWVSDGGPTDGSDSSLHNRFYIVTDVRFPNEANRIRELGGLIIRINRDTEADVDGHASEQDLSAELVDVHIHNRYSLADMRNVIYQFMDFDYPLLTGFNDSFAQAF